MKTKMTLLMYERCCNKYDVEVDIPDGIDPADFCVSIGVEGIDRWETIKRTSEGPMQVESSMDFIEIYDENDKQLLSDPNLKAAQERIMKQQEEERAEQQWDEPVREDLVLGGDD